MLKYLATKVSTDKSELCSKCLYFVWAPSPELHRLLLDVRHMAPQVLNRVRSGLLLGHFITFSFSFISKSVVIISRECIILHFRISQYQYSCSPRTMMTPPPCWTVGKTQFSWYALMHCRKTQLLWIEGLRTATQFQGVLLQGVGHVFPSTKKKKGGCWYQ